MQDRFCLQRNLETTKIVDVYNHRYCCFKELKENLIDVRDKFSKHAPVYYGSRTSEG